MLIFGKQWQPAGPVLGEQVPAASSVEARPGDLSCLGHTFGRTRPIPTHTGESGLGPVRQSPLAACHVDDASTNTPAAGKTKSPRSLDG